MSVLVDTSVWSLALRRRRGSLSREERRLVAELERLIRDGEVVMLGTIRQELLTGISNDLSWERLRAHLRLFPDAQLGPDEHEEASRCANLCRRAGLAATSVDMLICAIARLHEIGVFSADRDFERYGKPLGLRLHRPAQSPSP